MSDILGVTLAAVLTVATSVAASAAEPIALRDMIPPCATWSTSARLRQHYRI